MDQRRLKDDTIRPLAQTPTESTSGSGRPARPLRAVSVALPIAQLARPRPVRLSLLSQHSQVTNLVTTAGGVVAVVSETVGPGPFNVVVPSWNAAAMPCDACGCGCLGENRLLIGPWVIDLEQAVVWNPSPDWAVIGRSPMLAVHENQLRAWFRRQKPYGEAYLDQATAAALRRTTRQIVTACTWLDLQQGLAGLIGLGPGLTPLGDDWLAGWLLRQHLVDHAAPIANLPGHRPIDMITAFVGEHAAVRTTRLSQSWLRAAAAGWIDETWRQLLTALSHGPPDAVTRAAQRIQAHGATSGYAMLAGFLQETLS